MKLIVDRKSFAQSVQLASNAVNVRSPQEAMRCLYLAAANGTLVIRTTSARESIKITLNNVHVEKDGSALVNATKFSELLRLCDDETLHISTEGNGLTVKMADGTSKFATLPADRFPAEVKALDAKEFTLGAQELLGAIKKVSPLAVRNEQSGNVAYATEGVVLEADGKMIVCGTDCRRAGMCSINIKTGTDKAIAMIPMQVIQTIRMMNVDGDMRVSFGTNILSIECDGVELSTTMLEGTPPPVRSGMDWLEGGNHKATVSRSDLLNKVYRAAVNTTEIENGLRLSIRQGILEVSVARPTEGDSLLSMECKTDGPDTSVILRAKFLIEVLNSADADDITLELKDKAQAVLFRSSEDKFMVAVINK